MEIKKSYWLEMAHKLGNLPSSHQCSRLHGHSYEVILSVEGELDPAILWVQDYADISKPYIRLIHNVCDHRYLNEVMGTDATTAENFARWVYERLKPELPLLTQVEIRETRTASVIYRPTP